MTTPYPFAEEIIDYLESQGLVTKGTTMFYHLLPEPDVHPTVMHVIRETAPPPGLKIKPWAVSQFQVLSRGAPGEDWREVRLEAAQIYNNLHSVYDISLTNNYIVSSEGLGLPAPIGSDSQNREEVSCNYLVMSYAIDSSGTGTEGYSGDRDPNAHEE